MFTAGAVKWRWKSCRMVEFFKSAVRCWKLPLHNDGRHDARRSCQQRRHVLGFRMHWTAQHVDVCGLSCDTPRTSRYQIDTSRSLFGLLLLVCSHVHVLYRSLWWQTGTIITTMAFRDAGEMSNRFSDDEYRICIHVPHTIPWTKRSTTCSCMFKALAGWVRRAIPINSPIYMPKCRDLFVLCPGLRMLFPNRRPACFPRRHLIELPQKHLGPVK
jgi:hypothetical protein